MRRLLELIENISSGTKGLDRGGEGKLTLSKYSYGLKRDENMMNSSSLPRLNSRTKWGDIYGPSFAFSTRTINEFQLHSRNLTRRRDELG